MPRILLAWIPMLLGITTVSIASADEVTPETSSRSVPLSQAISEAAKSSASALDGDRIGDIDSTRQALLQSVDRVKRHLDGSTGDANAQAWLDYLEVADLLSAIESEARETEIAAKAMRVQQKATGLHPGLEVDALVDLRSAAEAYSNALRFRRKEQTATLLSKQLDRFADNWSKLASGPSPNDTATLRLVLDLLERTGQDVPLVQTAATRYSMPNVRVEIRDSLIHRVVNRHVDLQLPVRDCILGTRIVGNAFLSGDVTTRLIPAEGRIRLQVALTGQMHSKSRGYNGPVRVRTTGDGQLHAWRIINVGPDGISMDPIAIDASLQTQLNAIEHPLRLVRKLARKRADRQKHLTDQIANRKFHERIDERFAEETESMVQGDSSNLLDQAKVYLQRLDLPEPSRAFATGEHGVSLAATVRKGVQLAASHPPATLAESHEATVQIHESLIDNTLGTVLAGRTMKGSELRSLISRAKETRQRIRSGTGNQVASTDAEEAGEDEGKPDFEIDFDRMRPVIFEARDGALRLGVRGTRFAEGKRELKRGLEIAALYRPVTGPDGSVSLQRDGELQVNFPGTKRLSVTQTGLRASIKKAFAESFPESLMQESWTIPATAKLTQLRGRTFSPRYFSAEGGWLTLAVDSDAGSATSVANRATLSGRGSLTASF